MSHEMKDLKIRAIFQPAFSSEARGVAQGFVRKFGECWIMAMDEEGMEHALVTVHLTVPAASSIKGHWTKGHFFSSIKVMYDGIALLRELDRRGFLKTYEDLKANTFYDVLQCLDIAGIPLESRDNDDQMLSREVYELVNP